MLPQKRQRVESSKVTKSPGSGKKSKSAKKQVQDEEMEEDDEVEYEYGDEEEDDEEDYKDKSPAGKSTGTRKSLRNRTHVDNVASLLNNTKL